MLRWLYNWVMGLADHPHAVWYLAIVAFVESSFFPIPPDVLLIAMVLASRTKAWRFAFICTVASVLGGSFGYGIGAIFYNTLGVKIVAIYHLEEHFLTLKRWFDEWGAWAVVVGGLTPIPYKLVTITAGVVDMNFILFSLTSFVARGARFFLVAALLWYFGPPIRMFIEKRLTLVFTVSVIFLLGGFIILSYL